MTPIRAIYAGTFDPVHNGHVDIMQRASDIFGDVIVAVYDHGRPIKSVVFSIEERCGMIKTAIGHDAHIRVMPFSGLLVDFAQQIGARVLVRGLRVFSDFEFEFRMALANQRLAPHVETVTLITRGEHTFLSGTTVREIASFHGDVSSMVPPHVAVALREHYASQTVLDANPVLLRD